MKRWCIFFFSRKDEDVDEGGSSSLLCKPSGTQFIRPFEKPQRETCSSFLVIAESLNRLLEYKSE